MHCYCPTCAKVTPFNDSGCVACGWDPNKLERQGSFNQGYDRGNYGAAYESQDWYSWFAKECGNFPKGVNSVAYAQGMICGFFSSFEISEIPCTDCAFTVNVLRQAWKVDND